jgi:CheY-like chemotaxis protein
LEYSQRIPEETLINVAKAVAHLLNNTLSIVLTNSQLALHRTADLPDQIVGELRDWLQDIQTAAAESGVVIHRFQSLIDSVGQVSRPDISDKYPQAESPFYLEALSFPSSEHRSNGVPMGTLQQDAPARFGHISILIIDDEEKIRHALSYALTLGGHHVITAANGQEALALIQSRSYDIAFVDLKMPDMDGWEVARAIKGIESDTMVVLMTGWRVRSGDEKLKENNVDAVISKPFELSQIGDLIATAMNKGRLKT